MQKMNTSLPFRFHEKTEWKMIQQSMNSINLVCSSNTRQQRKKLYFCHISYTKALQFVITNSTLFSTTTLNNHTCIVYNFLLLSQKYLSSVRYYTTWNTNTQKFILQTTEITSTKTVLSPKRLHKNILSICILKKHFFGLVISVIQRTRKHSINISPMKKERNRNSLSLPILTFFSGKFLE